MQVLDRSKVAAHSVVGRITRARGVVAGALITLAMLVGSVVPAQADPTDLLGGAGDSMFTDLTTYLKTILIPAVLALAVIGIGVTMLVKWVKKARSAA